MSNESTQKQVQKLEQERAQVYQELALLQAELKIESSPDTTDVATELANQSLVTALVNRQKQKLQEIDAAIQQLQNGTYGICEGCQQPIDPERLAILPEAKYCIPCKQKIEVMERPNRALSQRQARVHLAD